MKTKIALVGLLSAALAGCWTVSETEFPQVEVKQAPVGKTVKVKLANYRTGVYNYALVEGHEAMSNSCAQASNEEAKRQQAEYVDRTMSWGLQNSASGRLVSRSIAELERKGYKIDRETPDYIIELKFANGSEDHVLRQIGYLICTLFTCEKNESNWKATLTVYDSTHTKALYTKDYEQDYEVTVWGPIPVASPACSRKISDHAGHSWALTALSDRALADATAFIAAQKK